MRHVSAAKKFRRFLGGAKGGAAVEMAVVFPVLVLLVIGVVDYGRVFYTSVTVANAARAGAEFGATRPGMTVKPDSIRAFAIQDGLEAGVTVAASRYCECSGAAAGCTATCGGGAVPDVFIEVTASKTVNFLLPYPGIPNSFFITRKAVMRSQ